MTETTTTTTTAHDEWVETFRWADEVSAGLLRRILSIYTDRVVAADPEFYEGQGITSSDMNHLAYSGLRAARAAGTVTNAPDLLDYLLRHSGLDYS